MRTTKSAAAAFATATMSVIIALPAAADNSVSNSNNCQNIRTIATSHCVHYDEKKRDTWANQQAASIQKQLPIDNPKKLQPDPNKPGVPWIEIENQRNGTYTIVRYGADGSTYSSSVGHGVTLEHYYSPTTTSSGNGGSGGRRSSR